MFPTKEFYNQSLHIPFHYNIYSLRVDGCSVVEYNHNLLHQFAHVIACKMLSLCSIYSYKTTARLHKELFQNKVCSLLNSCLLSLDSAL